MGGSPKGALPCPGRSGPRLEPTTYSLTGICPHDTLQHMQVATFGALGEPTRFRIVELLRGGPLAVGDIAEALSIRQPQASKHLGVLSGSGIVSADRLARRRIYHLEAAPFTEISHWVDSFERLWEARLGSLDMYLESITERTPDGSQDGRR